MHTPRDTSSKSNKLPRLEKLSYASGAVPFAFGYMGLKQLAFPVFNMSLGMSATMIGVVLACGRLWDAFSDPMMGTISDNARTRWGRRRPFILLGGFLCALAFPLLFWVPVEASSTVHFTWLLVASLILYTASTVFAVPWLSLSYEITSNPVERVSVQAHRAYVGGMVAMLLPWIYRWSQADYFADTITGMRWISLSVSAGFILFSIPVFLGCRERFINQAADQKRLGLRQAMKYTFSNRPFLILVCGIVTSMLCGPMLVGSLGIYINVYHIFDGDYKTGAAFAASAGTIMVFVKYIIIPITQKLVANYGKIPVVRGALLLGLFGSLSKFFFYTPVQPYLQFLSILFLTPAFTAFWMLIDPMKADCSDFDEYRTGMRREASYAAVANWLEKVSITVILVFSGVIVDASGFDPDLGGDQPEGTIFILRVAFAAVPALSILAALVCLHFYPLTDKRMSALRRRLEARRGHVD